MFATVYICKYFIETKGKSKVEVWKLLGVKTNESKKDKKERKKS